MGLSSRGRTPAGRPGSVHSTALSSSSGRGALGGACEVATGLGPTSQACPHNQGSLPGTPSQRPAPPTHTVAGRRGVCMRRAGRSVCMDLKPALAGAPVHHALQLQGRRPACTSRAGQLPAKGAMGPPRPQGGPPPHPRCPCTSGTRADAARAAQSGFSAKGSIQRAPRRRNSRPAHPGPSQRRPTCCPRRTFLAQAASPWCAAVVGGVARPKDKPCWVR